MKVIFLDIDGVLNSIDWMKMVDGLFDYPQYQIDPEAVIRLNKITDATGAKIVVSSTWRLPFLKEARGLDMLARCLASYGITGEVIGMTGRSDFTSNRRGKEIQEWLAWNQVERFVILDDDSDMGDLLPYLVRTTVNHGLLDEHVDKIIERLND